MRNEKAKRIFKNYLSKKGLRNTCQRLKVLDTFLFSGSHITANDLYKTLKGNAPDIGIATVYRNLKLLSECGLAHEMRIGNEKTRYEQKYGHEHHDHLICLKCGSFTEVHDEKIERLKDRLAEDNDFIPQLHKLEIYGLCKKCNYF